MTSVRDFSSRRPSRRAVMIEGALGLAALPLAVHAEPGASESRTARAAGTEHLLTIDAAIDGKGPFRFVVDTGADHTVLSEDVADALRLTRGQQASVVGIARTVVADTVHVERIEIDNLSKAGLELAVLPRAELRADGYLGLDVIDGRRVTFDFQNQELTLDAPLSGYLAHIVKPDESVIRAGGVGGRLRSVDCLVDGTHAVAFLDSGADVTVGNSRLLAELSARRSAPILTETIELNGVTGGSVEGRMFAVDRIRLGNFDLSTSGMAIADLPVFGLWGLADTPALFVGMDFLSRFSKVTIDYGLKEYRLELASLELAMRGA